MTFIKAMFLERNITLTTELDGLKSIWKCDKGLYFNSLWPSDTYLCHGNGLSLVQGMFIVSVVSIHYKEQ